MRDRVAALAEQAKRAAAEIVRLVAHAMAESDDAAKAAAFEEEQEMILALIAAVIGADGVTTHHEIIFASLMGRNLDDPTCCRAYLEAYAARWNAIATTTPSFVSAVLRYDIENKTNLTRRIVHELRSIVHCTAMVDGEYAACESRISNEYLERMETIFRRTCWTVKWDEESLPPILPESTIRREDVISRGIEGGPFKPRSIM